MLVTLTSCLPVVATMLSRVHSLDSPILRKLKWLGIFENERVGLKNATPAEILQHILERKWRLREDDHDMIVMLNKFQYEELNGAVIVCSLLVLCCVVCVCVCVCFCVLFCVTAFAIVFCFLFFFSQSHSGLLPLFSLSLSLSLLNSLELSLSLSLELS
jgi:hypothetical protein